MNPPRRDRDRGLVRPYVVTEGRSAPSRNHFDHVTLIIAQRDAPHALLSPEGRAVLQLCRPGALSVAEISAYLQLPMSVLRIVLADLMDSGHITSRAPSPALHPRNDRPLLEALLRGLRAL
ncbi:hypothetical protein BIV57_04125 [Mangrovactinospora gilvigrisea]|uniref:DUF742 domain-containing protein n=1 Tax=Mangrovactinospora gilvigrisea TaxID=1428644 RepID=A0A1J7BJI0_9ACTN|nr:DUF742 domain-containing protein [Mangrovactinospora gilvigrisea]OIV38741.1 hypothetical protein BIV57_04125 [Mangrovactinospora gilvigrisea]